jgi:hypothetical protein
MLFMLQLDCEWQEHVGHISRILANMLLDVSIISRQCTLLAPLDLGRQIGKISLYTKGNNGPN